MISWKLSFERINEEYEMVKRKKQALDNLLSTGKISQSTYDSFNQEMNDAVTEIENRQKVLLEKMSSKISELEQQIKSFEMLLANFEIQHVGGEVDEEVYRRETDLLSMGLETVRQELGSIKEAVNQLSSSTRTTEATVPTPTSEAIVPHEIEAQPTQNVVVPPPKIEVAEETVSVETEESSEAKGEASEGAAEENVEENPSEPSIEPEVSEIESFRNPQETSQNTEKSQSTEEKAEGEEKPEE